MSHHTDPVCTGMVRIYAHFCAYLDFIVAEHRAASKRGQPKNAPLLDDLLARIDSGEFTSYDVRCLLTAIYAACM